MAFGILLAFLVCVSEASKDVFFSSDEIKTLPHLLKAFISVFFAIPLFGIAVGVTGLAPIQPEFWGFVFLQTALMSVALWLYMRALAIGSVAQTQPILALSTVFLFVTNPLFTDDRVPLIGWVGVFIVTFGIISSQLPEPTKDRSIFQSLSFALKEMFTQAGVRAKLGVAVIFSITANLDKRCVEHSDGPTYLFIYSILSSITLGSLFLWTATKEQRNLSHKVLKKLSIGGTINSVTLLLHMGAITLLPVPYVIALKRCSIVLVSCWGFFIRKDREPNWYRVTSIISVAIGVGVILLTV